MCRDHHNELHRHGNEMVWWANLGISPLELAKGLWLTSPVHVASNLSSRAAGVADRQMVVP
jgi:hypothetical protein